MSKKKTRKFGGKRYTWKGSHKTKRAAESHARNIRSMGINARVVAGSYSIAHYDIKGKLKRREHVKGWRVYTSPSSGRQRQKQRNREFAGREYRAQREIERMERPFKRRKKK